jgi:antitoxin component of MazEF toxin-antitoxin module
VANSYVTTCTEDEDGSLILDIPDELLDAMGWKEGTELSVEAFAGSIILRECAQPEVDGRLLQ